MEGNLPFLLCFTLYLKAISKYKPPEGFYLEGRFNGGYFALQVGGGSLYLEDLIHGGGYFRNFTVLCSGLLFYHVKFHRVLYLCTRSGAHNPERATLLCPGAQRFKDQFILRSIFSRNFEHQVSHYKSIGKTRRLENSISDALIAFTSFRFLSYYGCPRILNGASIFAEKVLQNDVKNNLTCENAVA